MIILCEIEFPRVGKSFGDPPKKTPKLEPKISIQQVNPNEECFFIITILETDITRVVIKTMIHKSYPNGETKSR